VIRHRARLETIDAEPKAAEDEIMRLRGDRVSPRIATVRRTESEASSSTVVTVSNVDVTRRR
jgi:hypothetical protein